MTTSLLIPLQVVAVIYNFINFCQTKVGGTPVYDFMTWDPIQETILFVITMLFAFSGFYLILCKVDQAVKLPFRGQAKIPKKIN